MKKHILKIGWIFIILAAAFFACRQELFEKEGTEPALTVKEAQAWFESSQFEFLLLKSGNKEKKTKVAKPEWKGAFATRNDKVEIVETHIVTNGGFGFATESAYEHWKATNNPGYMTSLTRLVVMKYRKSGEMVSFLMTIVGDKEYLETKQFKMWGNTYLKKEKDFSGLVLFHSPAGEFVNGWRFTNGEVTHIVNVNFENGFGVSLKSGYYNCFTYSVYGWFQDCIEWWTIGEVDGQEVSRNYNYTSCGAEYMDFMGERIECTYVDGGGSGGSSGGGYNPGNGSDPQSSLPVPLKTLFTNINLPNAAIDSLRKAFEKMDCRLNEITSLLELNSVKLGTLSINPDHMGNASFDGNNLTFTGDWAISTHALSHEWFHIGQRKLNNVNNATDGFAEFEAWLFLDIIETIRVGGDFASSNHPFAGYANNYGNSEPSKIPYQNWLNAITQNGTTFPDSFSNLSALERDFYYWGPIFAQVRNYHHLSFTNVSYYPKTTFDIKNCN